MARLDCSIPTRAIRTPIKQLSLDASFRGALMRRTSIALALVVLLPAFASNLSAQTAYRSRRLPASTPLVATANPSISAPIACPRASTTPARSRSMSPTAAPQVACVSPLDLQWNWTGDGGTPLLIYPLDGQGWFGLGPGVVLASGDVAFVASNPSHDSVLTTPRFSIWATAAPPTLVAGGSLPGPVRCPQTTTAPVAAGQQPTCFPRTEPGASVRRSILRRR